MQARVVRRASIVALAVLVIVVAALALRAGLAATGGDDDVIGTWGNQAQGEPHLRLDDDMKVTGNDGCNGFSGSFTLSDDGRTATFGQLLGTLMACPGVDTWLSRAGSAVLDGDTLIVMDRSGREIGRLDRAPSED